MDLNLQSVKEFLKPDWKKFLVTITLGGSIILLLIFFATLGGFIAGGPAIPIFMYLTFLLTIIGIPFVFLFSNSLTSSQLDYVIVFLANILYWYSLSCLIAWIYDKVKKK